jgi:hypothetical protein
VAGGHAALGVIDGVLALLDRASAGAPVTADEWARAAATATRAAEAAAEAGAADRIIDAILDAIEAELSNENAPSEGGDTP